MKFLLLLNICLCTNGLRLKKYKRASLSTYDVLKESSAPKSYLQCSTLCSNQYICEGVLFDGTTCTMLRNVKVDETSKVFNGWIDEDHHSKNSKFLQIQLFWYL